MHDARAYRHHIPAAHLLQNCVVVCATLCSLLPPLTRFAAACQGTSLAEATSQDVSGPSIFARSTVRTGRLTRPNFLRLQLTLLDGTLCYHPCLQPSLAESVAVFDVLLQMPDKPPHKDEACTVLGERRYQGSAAKPPPAADTRALQAVTAILSVPAGRSKRKRKSSSLKTGLRQARVPKSTGLRLSPAEQVFRSARQDPPFMLTVPTCGLVIAGLRRPSDSPYLAPARWWRHPTKRTAAAASQVRQHRALGVSQPQTRWPCAMPTDVIWSSRDKTRAFAALCTLIAGRTVG